MQLNPPDIPGRITKEFWPKFEAEKCKLDRIDRWARFEHETPYQPRQATPEYRELTERTQTPYLKLIVNALVQGSYVDGYRRPTAPEDAKPWTYWQANGMDARQIAVHRATFTYGLSYLTVLPGKTDTGVAIPVMRGVSPRRMFAFYDDPAEDDWPQVAMRVDPSGPGWKLRLYDEQNVYTYACDAEGKGVVYLDVAKHGVGVCPVVRFANEIDLEGRADGEVEGLIPLQARIDQTVFDRLIVQRFASWIVRTVSGMETVAGAVDKDNPTAAEIEASKLRLRVEDILVADDKDVTFGSLPATPLSGFIDAHDADLKDLSAVSQTPPHYMLGQMVNLSAEALAAAETGATRKRAERHQTLGESWEQSLRLGASIMGDGDAAADMEAQVRWRDVESRSLAQVADALGKIATMLAFPPELLWEKLPGISQQDVELAKNITKERGGIDAMLRTLLAGATSPAPTPRPGPTPLPAPAPAPAA